MANTTQNTQDTTNSNTQMNMGTAGTGSTGGMDSNNRSEMGSSDNVERLTDSARFRSSRIAREVGDKARDYYDDASMWIGENYGKTLLAVGAIAAIGTVGYFLFRRRRDAWSMEGYSEGFTGKEGYIGNTSRDRELNSSREYRGL